MFPFGVVASVRLVDDGGEGLGQGRTELLVIGDVEARVERLVRQATGPVA